MRAYDKQIKRAKWMESVLCFFESKYFAPVLAVFTFIIQLLGLDIFGFVALALAFSFVCVFGSSTNACIPILCMAIFCVSTQNSPFDIASAFQGVENGEVIMGEPSTYYASPLFIICALVFGTLLAAAIVYRLVKHADYARVFSGKGLFFGIAAMAVSFLLAGYGVNFAWHNFIYGAIQAATFLFVYIFFAATLDFKTFSLDYLAETMIWSMIHVIVLVGYIYLTRFKYFMQFDGIWKGYMVAGWGLSLDFGSYIAMLLPACFYRIAKTKKHVVWWILLVVLAYITLYFTLARGAILFASLSGLLALVMGLRSKRLRKPIIGVLIAVGVALVALLVALVQMGILEWFIAAYLKGEGDISNGRLDIWSRFTDYFFRYPLFGGGFSVDLDAGYTIYEIGVLTIYSSLAHSTIYQFMGSCGIFGLWAFYEHCLSIVKMFDRGTKRKRLFLLPVLFCFFGMSMLDTLFFKAHYTFFYIIVLLVCEAEVRKNEKPTLKESIKAYSREIV